MTRDEIVEWLDWLKRQDEMGARDASADIPSLMEVCRLALVGLDLSAAIFRAADETGIKIEGDKVIFPTPGDTQAE